MRFFCQEIPSRQVGSQGNRDATEFFARVMGKFGLYIEKQEFDCIDQVHGEICLTAGGKNFQAFISPYTIDCDVQAVLVEAVSIETLNACKAKGKILLLRGALTVEQLMPKNFSFYNPPHHQKIYCILEEKQPAAIITATTKNPELVGSLYPFPMIEDGDFDIPSAYMTAREGEKLADFTGQKIRLRMDASRIPSISENIIARRGTNLEARIVVTAHIDAKPGTPGALDNAGSVVILMLLGELLQDCDPQKMIELVAINGEDYFSAPGQVLYLQKGADYLPDIQLVINMDGVGLRGFPTAYSTYGCPENIEDSIHDHFAALPNFQAGQPWYQGDHGIFIAKDVPAMALTTSAFEQLCMQYSHTTMDNLHIADISILVDTAHALDKFLRAITT